MDDKAKRIHSIKRLVWTLGIVNVVALLMILGIAPNITGSVHATVRDVRSKGVQTDRELLLFESLESLAEFYGSAMFWTFLLLLTQLIVLAIVDRRLAKELPVQVHQTPGESLPDR